MYVLVWHKATSLVYTALAPIILIFRSVLFGVSFQFVNCVFCPKICAVVRFYRGALGFLSCSVQPTAETLLGASIGAGAVQTSKKYYEVVIGL